jgi:GNAT superfamily N-acetyltransferase
LGGAADVETAVAVYERSALARRAGVWPDRAARLEHVGAVLRDTDTWFHLATEDEQPVAMAAAKPLRSDDGAGQPVPGGCFLNLIFVVPERLGEGIGGAVLDALLAEARRRGYSHVRLLTHVDNERSHRLYASRGFSLTGRVLGGEGEWAREL